MLSHRASWHNAAVPQLYLEGLSLLWREEDEIKGESEGGEITVRKEEIKFSCTVSL